jgi:phosphohistidine phosphatase SixA
MNTRALLKRYPERFVSYIKIWTIDRNTIECVASHEPMIGELLAVLCSLSEPATDEQREALQRLHAVFYPAE